MKKVFLLILLLLSVYKSNGQNSTKSEKSNIRLLKSEKYDRKLKRYLNLKETMMRLVLYPSVDTQTVDTLLTLYKEHIDPAYIIHSLNSDSIRIYLKQSYNWNLKHDLPHKHRLSNLKYMFKNESKYTQQDRELMNYLQFYTSPNDSLVERYVIYRSMPLNEDTIIQVIHEIKPKSYQITLLEIDEIPHPNYKTSSN